MRIRKTYGNIKVDNGIADLFRVNARKRNMNQTDYLKELLELDNMDLLLDGSPLGKGFEQWIRQGNRLLDAKLKNGDWHLESKW